VTNRSAQSPEFNGIRCTGIQKGFGVGQARVQVLHGLNFEAKAGETTFLIGPSGCGKTTLITIIAGLLKPDSGSISIFGQPIETLGSNALAFVFQQFNLLGTLDIVENAALPLTINGVPPRTSHQKARQVLEQLGLGPHLKRYPAELSGGQQQRVAIARALVHDPKIVICDEPTASLDSESGQAVMQLFKNMAAAPDRCVILVTHDQRIYTYADRIISMSDGHITGDSAQPVLPVEGP
jgi:putative ABC transport system ATP-binding protein